MIVVGVYNRPGTTFGQLRATRPGHYDRPAAASDADRDRSPNDTTSGPRLRPHAGTYLAPPFIESHPPPERRPACAGRPDDFFADASGPTGRSIHSITRVLRAKETCRGCPLRERCRDWALSQPNLDGVWGGTTVSERETLRGTRRTSGF